MPEEITYPIRINRYLAQKGLATRRGADELIEAGLVTIAGKKAVLGDKVASADIEVVILKDPKRPTKKHQYIAYYKPRGIITHSPAEWEQSIEQISGYEVEAEPEPISAEELGTLVHTVLERLDYSRPETLPQVLETIWSSSRKRRTSSTPSTCPG